MHNYCNNINIYVISSNRYIDIPLDQMVSMLVHLPML